MRPSTAMRMSVILAILSTASALASAQEGFKHRGGTQGEVKVNSGGSITLDAQLRSQARDLAASTADEALNWEDKQAAVRVLSQAADILWADYPERSREWLTRAWALTGNVSSEDGDNAVRRFRSNSPRSRARATVLTVAQKHDRLLADRLLEQVADENEQSTSASSRGIFDDRTARSEQLLNVALAVVESDPAAAADLAERSLTDGVSFQLQGLLLKLRGRDEARAGRLFDAALDRLALGFTHPSEGQVLASYLFTPGRVLGAGSGRATALAVGTQGPIVGRTPAEDDPIRARRFLGVMQRILLSMPAPSTTGNPSQAAQEFVTLSGSLANGFKSYAPELWPAVEQRMAQAVAELAPASADDRLPSSVSELKSGDGADEKELNRLYEQGLEEAAEKEFNPAARRLAFVRAALETTPGELERGRKLAAKIDEEDLREQVVSFLVYRSALLDLETGRLDEAVKLATEAKPVQHAIVLITAAQRMTAERPYADQKQALSRKTRALDLLSEAEKLLERDDLPGAALRIRIGLVAALAPLDVPRALEAFDNVVAAINKDASFDASDTSAPRIADLTGSSESLLPRIRNGYGIKDAVTLLARADFEGSFMVAAKLSAPAVRGICMLEIARSILSADPIK
jgi:hypothetical protein